MIEIAKVIKCCLVREHWRWTGRTTIIATIIATADAHTVATGNPISAAALGIVAVASIVASPAIAAPATIADAAASTIATVSTTWKIF